MTAFIPLMVMVTSLMLQRHRVIDLSLSSPDYLFRRGRVVLFRSGSLGETTERGENRLPSVETGAFEASETSLEDNIVRGLQLSGPGRFRCEVRDLELLRVRDQKHFHVRYFVLPEFALAEVDFQKGSAEINVNAQGIFKLVVLDQDRQPIPRKKVQFHNTMISSDIAADENGELIFLGNPTEYHFELGAERDNLFGLLIMPL